MAVDEAQYQRDILELRDLIAAKADSNIDLTDLIVTSSGLEPPKISGLVATEKIEKTVLTWNTSPITDLKLYDVEVDTTTDFTAPESFITRETTWTHATGTAGTTYYYRVRAENTSGSVGEWTTSVEGTPALITVAEQAPAAQSGWTLLTTTDFAGDATFEVVTEIDTAYRHYVIWIANLVPTNDATILQMEMTEDGGATWKTGAADYAYSMSNVRVGGAAGLEQDGGHSAIQLSYNGANALIGNDTGEGYSGFIQIYDPQTSGKYVHMVSLSETFGSTAAWGKQDVAGMYMGSTNGVNGFRFLLSAGTIASGHAQVYGIK